MLVKSPKKLIEVALPLDAINFASAAEKLVKVGKPTNLHLWWARRPLSAARAVIFAQLVNDPSWKWEMDHHGDIPPSHLKASWAASRKRLFKIIEDLVLWENTSNEEVLERARLEIRRSWQEVCELNKDNPLANNLFNPENLPAFHDPFAGGGVIPLEAQRLGLESHASDLNPVSVLINKALIEFPSKFAGLTPVGPEIEHPQKGKKLSIHQSWPMATGLVEDISRYGAWIRDEAYKRIGQLYPPIKITPEMTCERPDLKPLVGQSFTIIAWLWARTIKSPNPAFSHVEVPLVSNYILSSKEGKQVYVHPIVKSDHYKFSIKLGKPPLGAENGTKLARANFGCILSKTPISTKYIRDEACNGRFGVRLMAIIADGPRGRLYLDPTEEMEAIAFSAKPKFKPDLKVTTPCHDIDRMPMYGMFTWGDIFTNRQLVGLSTFSNLVSEVRDKIRNDAVASGMIDDGQGLAEGGLAATAYAEALSVYLAFAMTRMADWGNSLARWESKAQVPQQLFGKHAVPMVWDFCETNFFSTSTGSYAASISNIENSFKKSSAGSVIIGHAEQADAQTQRMSSEKFISTDPPYYDNIGYADLSDFFYIWLRRALRPVFPSILATISVPKTEELVAAHHRHGSGEKAEAFFLNGMTLAMKNLAAQAHPGAPITIYYAFKQSETKAEQGTVSTGWVIFLNAVFNAGLQLTGTWPLRTENTSRMMSQGTNALASSIILVCRKRSNDAPTVSRRDFLRELNKVLPEALDEMTKGSGDDRSPVAPVDLSQAIIGPGMAVFSKYAAVLEADGSSMSVRTALQLINRFLAEDDFDHDTQFCLHWFEQNGWGEGRFGDADTLSRAKGTSVEGVKEAGVVESGGGIVRLRKWSEYPKHWEPETDTRNPIWETLHHLIRSLKEDGESSAGRLLADVKSQGESVRQLTYRLYTLCERQGWAEDARAYNELITSWTGIESAAGDVPVKPTQGNLF